MISDGRLRYDWSQILVPGELKRNPWINEKEQMNSECGVKIGISLTLKIL